MYHHYRQVAPSTKTATLACVEGDLYTTSTVGAAVLRVPTGILSSSNNGSNSGISIAANASLMKRGMTEDLENAVLVDGRQTGAAKRLKSRWVKSRTPRTGALNHQPVAPSASLIHSIQYITSSLDTAQ